MISSIFCFLINPIASDKGFFESGNVVTGLGFGLLAVLAEMVTGWLDDRSKNAWNEYIKGASVLSSAFTSSEHACISPSRDLM